jgi:membrane protease YdiL (CAAX protease family)
MSPLLTPYSLFVLLTLVLTGWISYNTYVTAKLLRTWQPESNPLLHPLETLVRLALIAACIGLGLLSGLSPAALGWTLVDGWRQAAWGAVAGLLLGAVFLLATRWMVQRTGERFYSPLVLELIVPKDPREFVLTALAMVTVVLLEELLFRSLLIGGLAPIAPAPLLAVLFGVLFGLLHSPQGAWGMAGAGLGGVFLGGLFLLSGSLFVPCMAHYAANMLQLGVAYRNRRQYA